MNRRKDGGQRKLKPLFKVPDNQTLKTRRPRWSIKHGPKLFESESQVLKKGNRKGKGKRVELNGSGECLAL